MDKYYFYKYSLEDKEIKFLKQHYSIRKLAKKLKISPSFLCDILNRKRYIPEKRVKDFMEALENGKLY